MPHVKVKKNGNIIGTVTQDCSPSYLCKEQVSIHKGGDAATPENKIMTIKKCFINCHNCCATPSCGSCGKELHFEILDKGGQVKTDVSITKVHAGCCMECFSAGDMYKFKPPHDADEAALFIAAVQFIDMLYYENPWSCSG